MTDIRPWVMVLAGGEARRMGGDKALRPWRGTTLIEATLDRLRPQAAGLAINARPGELLNLGLPVVTDATPYAGRGPLSGVRTALTFARDAGLERIATVPCDMPLLPLGAMARLAATEADVVAFEGAQMCALWHVSLLPAIETALQAAGRGLAVMRFMDTCRVAWLPGGDGFDNINTPEDLERAGGAQ